jgi:hypothetical protein
MSKAIFFLISLVFCTCFSFGQNSVTGPIVKQPVYFDVSPPLRDMVKNLPKKAETSWKDGIVKNHFNNRPHPTGQEPGGLTDPGLQMMNGSILTDTTIVNFDGNSNTEGVLPPDTHGEVGLNHYFQVVNSHFSIYSKAGVLLLGPLANNSIWSGMSNNSNDGDAIILYDDQADRWLFSQFSLSNYPNSPFYQMIAISQTGDPTGSWYRYQYSFTDMPDYPKFGIWGDGYYMSMHRFASGTGTWLGVGGIAYNRTLMLAGSPAATTVMFTKTSSDEAYGWLPSDCDGPFPAGNPPNYFLYNYDGASNDHLGIYEFHVDWVTPANSTFTNFLSLPVTAFTANIVSLTQPGTTVKLDPMNDRMMYRLQYRKFSDHEAMVCNHTIDISTSVAGIRWYELRKTTGAWSIFQQGTYSPADNNSRWMGSIALDSSGNMALGYSVTGAALYPSIRYTGRKKNDAMNTMTIAERGIINGGGSQTYYDSSRPPSRWGDYSGMSCDPGAKATFWYTQEYYTTTSTSGWKTRIASFSFINIPIVSTLPATVITNTGGTLNANVNPNGLSSTYNFEWGTSTSYGNSSTITSAGSGTSNVAVTVSISGLTAGVTCHYRVNATNGEGTANGIDMTFTPGAAALITTAASSITSSTASSGGNVTIDGGASVTIRGVCWSTAANPTTSDPHTSNGSGTGSFTSSITGLSATTTYHIRAYATNANGTWYGDDKSFTTSCGMITILPLTEGFESLTTTPACWTEENSNPAWQYLTGNGNTHPSSAHLGTRNACLKDATTADNLNKLISPVLDLSLYNNVILTFYHTQAVWSPDQDQLKIYYRTSSGGTWALLATYTSSITAWTLETITLPNLGSYYQIAFEGNAKYGYGVCIDDIALKAPGNWVGGTIGNLNAWETATNWGDGIVPTAATNVYIPARTYLPVVTSTTAVCNNLVIENSAGIGVNLTKVITVNGKVTLK